MLEWVDGWIRALGPVGYLVLGLAALVEYLFPPFPGDTVTLLGGAYAAGGQRSVGLVLVSLVVGSLGGMAVMWRVGLALGARLSTWPPERRVLGVPVARLQHAQALMRTKGAWLLVANRFLPSFRAVLFIAAGASGMSLSYVLLLGGVSALAWSALLVAVGVVVGDNAQRIDTFFATYRATALGIVAVVGVGLVLRWWWRRRRVS